MSTATTTSQVRSLIRRYLVTITATPMASLLVLLIVPSLILAAQSYTVIKHKEDEESFKKGRAAESLPVVISLMTILSVYNFCKLLVSDKATGIRSLMFSMGLTRFSYYLAYSLIMMAAIMPLVLALAVDSLLQNIFIDSLKSNFTILGVFILFTFHLTGLIFVLSSFVSKTIYVAFIFLAILLEQQIHKSLLHLIMFFAPEWRWLPIFMASASPFESLRIFCHSYILCKNCNQTQYDPDSGLMSQPTHLIIVAMIFWATTAFVFANWFDQVCLWRTDSPSKSPLFCSLSDIRYKNNSCYDYDLNEEVGSSLFEIDNIENVLDFRCMGIPEISESPFEVNRGQHTALLGLSGAGKTSLMNMILDKLKLEGTTLIDGCVKNEGSKSATRQSFGVCPQTSVLDPGLTVRQHLDLFASIKTSSMSGEELEKHIRENIKVFRLDDHQGKLPFELSNGMRRQLSLALAFVGGSEIVFLDEPTGGLDRNSRWFVRDAIGHYQDEGTVCFLSTIHFEEADNLCNRIAIMNKGQIFGHGTATSLIDWYYKHGNLVWKRYGNEFAMLFYSPDYIRKVDDPPIPYIFCQDGQPLSESFY